jgi:hypothetical protein
MVRQPASGSYSISSEVQRPFFQKVQRLSRHRMRVMSRPPQSHNFPSKGDAYYMQVDIFCKFGKPKNETVLSRG